MRLGSEVDFRITGFIDGRDDGEDAEILAVIIRVPLPRLSVFWRDRAGKLA